MLPVSLILLLLLPSLLEVVVLWVSEPQLLSLGRSHNLIQFRGQEPNGNQGSLWAPHSKANTTGSAEEAKEGKNWGRVSDGQVMAHPNREAPHLVWGPRYSSGFAGHEPPPAVPEDDDGGAVAEDAALQGARGR